MTPSPATCPLPCGRIDYNPGGLLDRLRRDLSLRNDATLARALGANPYLISKVRHCRVPVGAPLLIRMHEVSGLSVCELRRAMGDRRLWFRVCEPGFGRPSRWALDGTGLGL